MYNKKKKLMVLRSKIVKENDKIAKELQNGNQSNFRTKTTNQ